LSAACQFQRFDFRSPVSGQASHEIKNTHINIGTGVDLTIKELAEKVKAIIGFQGELVWDSTKPDGTPKKLLDVSKIHQLGWKEMVGLDEGINRVYANYCERK
jgi:GDP-L-fucose synthase